jgi:hypothetical protein
MWAEIRYEKVHCNTSADVLVYLDGAPFARGYAKAAWRALYKGKHVVVKRPVTYSVTHHE